MKALAVSKYVSDLEVPLFETRDLADLLGISTQAAAKHLENLRSEKIVERVLRGKWVIAGAKFDPLQVPDFLTAPFESYISLQTALFHHGLIEQIPSRIYAVTEARSRVVRSPVGTFSFHHCVPSFFAGYEYIKPYLKLATPEKALVDFFYFAPAKSRQFTRLPEIEIPRGFSWKKARAYCELIPSKRTRSLVESRLREVGARMVPRAGD